MFGSRSKPAAAAAAAAASVPAGAQAKGGGNTTGLVTAALVVSSVLVTGYRIATTGLEGDGGENVGSTIENGTKAIQDNASSGGVLKEGSVLTSEDRRYSQGETSPGHRGDQASQEGLARSQSLGLNSSPSCRASPMERNASVTATAGMERVTGRLQKQGDMLGLWRQRYFELASYDSVELEAFAEVAPEFKSSSDDKSSGKDGGKVSPELGREFFLLYWSCDAAQAQSEKHRYSPRGMFLLREVQVSHESPLTLVLTGLINAFNPSAAVPPVKLAAAQARSVQKWASALSFAAVASALPAASYVGCRPFPMPAKSGTLGRPVSVTGDAALSSYFRLYNWSCSENSNDSRSRTFLLSWESEQRADMRPLRPRNVYELTPECEAKVTVENPDIVVLENVDDFCFANAQPISNSKRNYQVILKMSNAEDAASWATALVPDPERCTVPSAVAFDEGEDVIDEYIPPGTSSAAMTPENAVRRSSFEDDVYIPEGEQVMDEFLIDSMDDSGLGSLNGSNLDFSLSSVDEADAHVGDVDDDDSFDYGSGAQDSMQQEENDMAQSVTFKSRLSLVDEGEEDEQDDESYYEPRTKYAPKEAVLDGNENDSWVENESGNEENLGGFMGNLNMEGNFSVGHSYKSHLAKRGLLSLDVDSSCVSSPRFAPLSPVTEECETESRRSSTGSSAY